MVFFCIHYGMFTLVHGIFTWQLAHRIGTTGSVRGYLLVLLARAGGSLDTAAPVAGATAVLPAVALVVLKTVIDAGLHLRVHRATEAPVPVAVPSA